MTVNYAKLFAANMAKVTKMNAKVEEAKTISKIDKFETTDLGEIKGVGDSTVKKLLENGIQNIEELKEVGIEKIKELELNPFSVKALKKFFNK